MSALGATAAWSKRTTSATKRSLAKAATREFERRPFCRLPPRKKHHAFVAAGWARFADAKAVDDFRPYLAVISNVMDEEGRQLAEPGAFSLFAQVLQPEEEGFYLPIGAHVAKSEQDAVIRRLSHVDAAGAGPEGFMEVLGEEVRRVAGTNRAVGRGLLFNILPRASIRPGHTSVVMLAGGPIEEEQTFLYVAPDDTEGVQYGPIFVHGGAVMSGFTATSL